MRCAPSFSDQLFPNQGIVLSARDTMCIHPRSALQGYLLQAGLCVLCQGDHVAIENAVEKYQARGHSLRCPLLWRSRRIAAPESC